MHYFYASTKYNNLHVKHQPQIPHSQHPWAHFTHIKIPCVNSSQRGYSNGLLLGLVPATHGRHSKVCITILKELYEEIKSSIHKELCCKDFLDFRNKFGIRPAFFKPSKNDSESSYHIISTRSTNFALLLKSVENHTQRTNSLPHIYNLEVAPIVFPDSRDRANMSQRQWSHPKN